VRFDELLHDRGSLASRDVCRHVDAGCFPIGIVEHVERPDCAAVVHEVEPPNPVQCVRCLEKKPISGLTSQVLVARRV
jgi:hypothetical protein